MLTASWNAVAKVWDLNKGTVLATVHHDAAVNAVAFGPNGKYFATASGDFKARVWRADSFELLTTLPHAGWVSSVAFSPDGDHVITGSTDTTATISSLSPDELSEQLCQILSRNLSASEWRSYIQLELTQYDLSCLSEPVHPSLLDVARENAEAANVDEAAKLYGRLLKISQKANQELDLDPTTPEVEQDPVALAKSIAEAAGDLQAD